MIVIRYFLVALFGLIVGSFLNVVIYRLPLMTVNLWLPRSHCPHCKTPLRIRDNIPLVSFIGLKGQCAHCHTAISYRYPIIELLSLIMTVLAFWHFGMNRAFLGGAILSWGLLVASVIDLNEGIIPDAITLPLLWVGLLFNAFSTYTSPQSAIFGAAIGYVFFWSIAKLFLIIRKKEGLGYGDFKLLAMLGAWIGIAPMLYIILIAALSGVLVSVGLIITKKIKLSDPIPFGPFLAIAGYSVFLLLNFR